MPPKGVAKKWRLIESKLLDSDMNQIKSSDNRSANETYVLSRLAVLWEPPSSGANDKEVMAKESALEQEVA